MRFPEPKAEIPLKVSSKFFTSQFSLKILLLTTSLVAIGLVPLALTLDAWRKQERAIQLLENRGVLIGYANQWNKPGQYVSASHNPLGSPTGKPPGSITPATRTPGTRQIPGAGNRADGGANTTLLQPVDFVCAVEYNAGVAGLSPILLLPTVNTIAYVNSRVTPEIVELFCRMPQLKTLNLSDTDLDDEALMRFGRIESLEYISIMGTKVTPDAVLEFKRLRPDCTISSDLDTRFLLCLQRLLELRAAKSR